MESKTCTICNLEKHITIFYEKDSGCEDCNSKRGLSRYYEKKIKDQINERHVMKKIKINLYKNKMLDSYNSKNQLEHVLN